MEKIVHNNTIIFEEFILTLGGTGRQKCVKADKPYSIKTGKTP
jgi:hypothetical protein